MTMLGNSEDIKRFCSSTSNYKNQNLVEIEKGLQLLRGIWLLILKFPNCAFMFNHQIVFPREFAVFDTAICCQFLVWELLLDCQSTFILQFDGLSIGNYSINLWRLINFAFKWILTKIRLHEFVSLSLVVCNRQRR